ncbi:ubiquitin carboxyl-terminal hydrolase [Mycolicibacterium thermoresistibile]|uniref:Ubiquitin carboxyl-terminal hydrolase n=1 Tax=Mycolicibacterium thermoresistibile TaxID=1797 RepID=A0A117ILD3_MYCTH|nr:ubiquitin carboxyl-terminal hydrolase [Mycolicibacterium thermoresistibile]
MPPKNRYRSVTVPRTAPASVCTTAGSPAGAPGAGGGSGEGPELTQPATNTPVMHVTAPANTRRNAPDSTAEEPTDVPAVANPFDVR